MNVSWSNPAIQQLLNNMTGTPVTPSSDTPYSCAQALAALPSQLNSYCIDGEHSTSYWVVQDDTYVVHPLHLHNHDFNVSSLPFKYSTVVHGHAFRLSPVEKVSSRLRRLNSTGISHRDETSSLFPLVATSLLCSR